ncbi:MAG TPA: DUF3471 domain-containing protein, partial [Cytophagaceae bacterium]
NERYTSEYVKMLNQTKEQIEALKNSVPQNTKLSLELKDYCGEYNHDGYGKVLITEKDGNLVAKWGRLESTLEHLCFDSFLLPLGVLSLSVPVKFNVDFMGKVTSVDIDFESSINEMIRFVKIS